MPADRGRPKRAALGAVLLALTALATIAYVDYEERQSIVRLAATDIQSAANKLAQVYPTALESCPNSRPPGDYGLLAEALAAVEQLGTSSIERAFEATFVRLAIFTGLPVPDYSLGPGQIRPSTAVAAVSSPKATGTNDDLKPERQRVALDLLSDCASHELGVLVLTMLAGTHPANTEQLDRKSIMHLAAAYNAQITSTSTEAAIANFLYRELTYQVFQELKFQRRQSALKNGN